MVVEAVRSAHWYRMRCSLLFITSVLSISLLTSSVAADFIVRLSVESFNNPNNTDANGVCCNETEGMSACSSPCDVLVNFCIRPIGPALPETVNPTNCPVFSISTSSGGTYHVSSNQWPGRVQLLFHVVESDDNNLVDQFVIEYDAVAAQADDTPITESLTSTGTGGAVLNFSIGIQCQPNFHGPSCDCQNTNDTTGHYTCTRLGDRECLEGYQNPSNNCTECSTSLGCSELGGFCEQPGDCMCRDGYAGDNCTQLISTSVQYSVIPTPTVLGTTPGNSSMVIVSMEPTPPPVVASSTTLSTPTPSRDISPSSSIPDTMLLPSFTSIAAMLPSSSTSTVTILPSPSTTISLMSPSPATSSDTVSSSSSSSTVPLSSSPAISVLPLATASTVPVFSTASDVNSMNSARPTPSVSSQLSTQPVTTITSVLSTTSTIPSLSFPPTTSTIPSSPFPPTTSTIPSSPFPSTTSTIPSSPFPSTTSTIPSSSFPSTTQPSPSMSTETSQVLTTTSTPVMTQTPTHSVTTPQSTRSSPPSPPTSQSTRTTETPTSARRSGNTAAIAGAVVTIIVVVVVVVSVIPCVYCIVKRLRLDRKEQAVVFLDQVYNAPVTFVNHNLEEVPPRSPQLFIPTNQEPGGYPLDVIHKPAFREQAPYAESGPSSDHVQSPESSRVYQLEDAEVTIITNPHSLSQSSNSPRPSTPAASSLNRNSGLGFDYRDDPIGDAYLSNQYIEQPQRQPNQSSAVSTVPESPQRAGNGVSPHLLAPPLPPRVVSKPSPKPRAKTYGEKLPNDQVEAVVLRNRNRTSTDVTSLRNRREEEEEEEEGIKKRVSNYLQAAQEEGEKRQSFIRDINFFTDINLDMSTQTEL